jgi:hypothetical protein
MDRVLLGLEGGEHVIGVILHDVALDCTALWSAFGSRLDIYVRYRSSSAGLYDTSTKSTVSPANSKLSPGTWPEAARASGETYDSVPRVGLASSSPTI